MAQAKKYPHIVYKTGVRGKHGISFESLSKSHKRLLLEHQNIRHISDDPQVMGAIFGIYRTDTKSIKHKLFWDWRTESLRKIDPLKESYDMVPWKCALSNRKIMSSMNDFSPKNFVHPDYWDTLSGGIDMSIVESSVAFRIKCQKLLTNQQKELLKLFKSNANPRNL
jgi:hypothetical protein